MGKTLKCHNCKNYFYLIGKMATVDISKLVLIYFVNNNRHRFDFELDNTNRLRIWIRLTKLE